ncbi:MgtC/SapB family protein, partial [Acinetobacter nosocomialis]
GLTTAAIIWASAGIGIAAGAGFVFDAVIATVMILVSIRLSPLVQRWVHRKSQRRRTKFNILVNDAESIGKVTQLLVNNQYRIEHI